MAIIAGVTIDWQLSPRVITIPSSETEVSIRDLQDTLLDLEDDVEGILWTTLRETSGGEDLGGGVFVGWTMELQNAVIAPAPRLISIHTGTATTANPIGTILIDAGATFITDGVEPGATIVNLTDDSVTSVISVDSETQLSHYNLDDGTDNDWDITDSYKVWNEVQFQIGGGNLVGVDEFGSPISPIRSTFGNEILKTSSSSATFTQQETLQYASFGGGVTIDVVNGQAGTTYPIGTAEFPSNNTIDAHSIADARGFPKFLINSDLTLSTEDYSDGHVFVGRSQSGITITINAGANVTDSEFNNATILGTLDGGNTLRKCIISDLNTVDGIIEDCILNVGTITLGGSTVSHFLNCFSGVPGSGTPTIDLGGSGQSLAMRNYNGGIALINKSGVESVSIDMNSGQVMLDSTITNGDIIIRGLGKLTDNSVGANVNSEDLLNRDNIAQSVWDEPIADHLIVGTTGDSIGNAQFLNKVTLNTATGTSGTLFPIGTSESPVDNLIDALSIAVTRGFSIININSNLTIANLENVSGYTITSEVHSTITLSAGCITAFTNFHLVDLAGVLNGYAIINDCSTNMAGLSGFFGIMDRVVFNGDIIISSDTTKNALFIDCYTGDIIGFPTIDLNGDGAKCSLRGLTGVFQFVNKTGTTRPIFIDLYSARVGFESTITAGSFTIRGIGHIAQDDSTGATFDTLGLISQSTVSVAVWDELRETHDVDGSFGDHINRIRNQKV